MKGNAWKKVRTARAGCETPGNLWLWTVSFSPNREPNSSSGHRAHPREASRCAPPCSRTEKTLFPASSASVVSSWRSCFRVAPRGSISRTAVTARAWNTRPLLKERARFLCPRSCRFQLGFAGSCSFISASERNVDIWKFVCFLGFPWI